MYFLSRNEKCSVYKDYALYEATVRPDCRMAQNRDRDNELNDAIIPVLIGIALIILFLTL